MGRIMRFLYDHTGLFAFEYDGATYYYKKNAQNDIIAILDIYGNVVVQYKYDAWGNHKVLGSNGNEITNEASIGIINPFRYRSYFYDTETGLYYLNSRYYDPKLGRFISPDDISYLDPTTVNGLNLYAYCGNNPVMGYDPEGTWDWGKFWKGASTVFATALFVVAVVASAGAVGALAGVAAASIGLSATAVSTAITIATVSTYVVAGTIGLFGASDAIEVFSGGVNPIRDYIMGGNVKAYNITKGVFNTLGTIATIAGTFAPKIYQKAAQHGGISKISNGKTVGYSKDFYDKNGVWNFRIDATTHGNPKWHHNPHYHKLSRDNTISNAVYYLWEILRKWVK